MAPTVPEAVVAGYFAYLLAVSAGLGLPAPRRTVVAAIAVISLALIAACGLFDSPAALAVRDWLPGLWILIGYWTSGLFFTAPMPRVEGWLSRVDARLGLLHGIARLPFAVTATLELAYLLTYALIPAGTAVAFFTQGTGRIDAFWVTVLLAEFGCYGLLPWIRTRPPRALEAAREERGAFRRANLAVLGHASIQVNTFPSGHAAGAFATALAVGDVAAWAAPAFWAAAVGVAAGAVVGRYHYTVDVLLGLLTAVSAWGIARLW